MTYNSDDKIKIFISYQPKTSTNIAELLKKVFLLYGGNRIHCFLCEDVSAGKDWQKWIEESIPQSNIMLLIYTKQDQSVSDWCMNEVGLFQADRNQHNEKLIVIHSPEVELPSNLKKYQAVKAEPKSISKFFRTFFGTSEIVGGESVLNTVFASDDLSIKKTANDISNLFIGSEGQISVDNNLDTSINIFISHRKKSAKQAAIVLQNTLELFGSGRINVRLSKDRPEGSDWRPWFKEQVGLADVVLLLCTNLDDTWKWCLHETGIFEGLNEKKDKHLAILHCPVTEPPNLLDNYLLVKAELESMKNFLKQFFGSSEFTKSSPPINATLASKDNDKSLSNAAEDICSHFIREIAPDEQRNFFGKYLIFKIGIDEEDHISSGLIPEEAILESNAMSLAMFGKGAEPVEIGRTNWTWKELKKTLNREEDAKWISALSKAMKDATEQGTIGEQVKAEFRPLNSGKTYNLLLHRLDVLPNGIKRYHLVFIEQLSKPTISAPASFATLLSSLTIGSRVQWEICDRYLNRLEEWKPQSDAAIKQCFRDIQDLFSSIDKESEFRKNIESDQSKDTHNRLIWAFHADDPRRKKIEICLRDQKACKNRINAIIASGEVETATLETILQDIKRLNVEIMLLAGERYQEFLQEISNESVDTSSLETV